MEEGKDNSALFFVHEEIGIAPLCSHECVEDLVDVCLHEIEGTVFQNEIQDYANYVGRWVVYGYEILVLLHEANDSYYAVFKQSVCS